MGFKKVNNNLYFNEKSIKQAFVSEGKYYVAFMDGNQLEISENDFTSIIGEQSSGGKILVNGVDYFEINFDSNGGTLVPKQFVEPNGKIYSPTMPTLTGKTFGGWFYNGPMFNFNTIPATKNMTLVALWED